MVMTTHNPDHVILLGGRAAIVDRKGGLVCGSVEEVVTQDRLREVYETDLRIVRVEELHRRACLHGGAAPLAGNQTGLLHPLLEGKS